MSSHEKLRPVKVNLEEKKPKELQVSASKAKGKSRNQEKTHHEKRDSEVKQIQLSYPAKIVIRLNDIMEEF